MEFELPFLGIPGDTTACGIVGRRRGEVFGIIHVDLDAVANASKTTRGVRLEPLHQVGGRLLLERRQPLRRRMKARMVVSWPHTAPSCPA
ncbi:MAG TPA: hypothetical protein VFT22_05540 [Kofleriaceae bacterium]|nr:hypothetical protein [Kofleriaceae bacterium]